MSKKKKVTKKTSKQGPSTSDLAETVELLASRLFKQLNNEKLMSEMVGKEERGARFRCTMVLARAGLEVANFSGTVEGRIIDSPRGGQGFGYDPLFIPEGYEETFAELGNEAKNNLSHRSRALMEVVGFLDHQD